MNKEYELFAFVFFFFEYVKRLHYLLKPQTSYSYRIPVASPSIRFDFVIVFVVHKYVNRKIFG